MKKIKAALPLAFGLLMVAGSLALLYFATVSFFRYLGNLDSDLAVAIVAGGVTAIVSVGSIAVSKAYETRSSVQADLRSKKTPIYEEIVETLYGVMFAKMLGKEEPTEGELLGFFAKTTEQLTIWGSDDLVKAFAEFKLKSAKHEENPTAAVFEFETLLLAIRKDLGHKNKGLERGSLLQLFVTDIGEHL